MINTLNKYNIPVIIISCAIISLIYFSLLQLDLELFKYLVEEDGVIESIGAISFFFASVGFTYLYVQSKAQKNKFLKFKTRRNAYYLLLAIMLFVCAGEEISWGQRIFGIETPALMQEINVQNEINIHNIFMFNKKNFDDSSRTHWQRMLSMNRLFSLFWLIFCFLIPVSEKLSSWLSQFYKNIGLPIVPIWIGILFIFNFCLFRVLVLTSDKAYISGLDETKESFYAVAYLVLALWMIRLARKNQLQ